MMNMQDSVEKLNGTFQIDYSNNSGTIIIVAFPLELLKEDENSGYKNIGS